jgi:hypothetical protein
MASAETSAPLVHPNPRWWAFGAFDHLQNNLMHKKTAWTQGLNWRGSLEVAFALSRRLAPNRWFRCSINGYDCHMAESKTYADSSDSLFYCLLRWYLHLNYEKIIFSLANIFKQQKRVRQSEIIFVCQWCVVRYLMERREQNRMWLISGK